MRKRLPNTARRTKSTAASVSTLGPRQIRVIASLPQPDRVGDILISSGCVIRGGSVPVLLDHNCTIENIVGRAQVEVRVDGVFATITFLPEGQSAKADMAARLYKSGAANGVSVGFNPIDSKPIGDGSGGWKYLSWELLELSLVVVPALAGAEVIQRGFRSGARSRPPMSSAQREAEIARLEAIARERDARDLARAAASGNSAVWCDLKRRQDEAYALKVASLCFERDPRTAAARREQQLRELCR